jgi:hypothetical protein
VAWTLVASVIASGTYWLVFDYFSAGPSIVTAIGLGIGTLAGGLLGTLYWLPKENGS